jgi:hypothetical protein
MKNQRIIHWWFGTDALKLAMVPPGKKTWRYRIYAERLLWKTIEPLISEHWVVAEHLKKHLIKFGIKENKIKVVSRSDLKGDSFSINYKKYKKKKHNGFNVLYYCPNVQTNQKFKDWVYGKDIFFKLMNCFPNINWIHIDGKQDMSKIFPVVDLYIRPNRSDGVSRLVKECKLNNIPVIATTEEPNFGVFYKTLKAYYET